MTKSQIEDIYNRLNTLTQKVNSLELLTGTIGTSQAAIAQIYSRLDNFTEATNSNFAQISQRFDRVETIQAEQLAIAINSHRRENALQKLMLLT